MTNNNFPNIGGFMEHFHHAINRGLDVSVKQSLTLLESGHPNEVIYKRLGTYIQTLGCVISAHHSTEDQLIFPFLRTKLPVAPYYLLSLEHLNISERLKELQETVELLNKQFEGNEPLQRINLIVADLKDLWLPHIDNEQRYLYDIIKTEAVLTADEEFRLIHKTLEYVPDQGNQDLILLFVLYNLAPEERKELSKLMPPELTQKSIAIEWKPQWSSMQPFLLD